MNVQIHSIKFDADNKLLKFIQKRMDRLDKYFDRIIDGEVNLRLNNEGIENKSVQVKINVPGELFIAESAGRSFEKAIDDCAEVMKRNLRKHKEKLVEH